MKQDTHTWICTLFALLLLSSNIMCTDSDNNSSAASNAFKTSIHKEDISSIIFQENSGKNFAISYSPLPSSYTYPSKSQQQYQLGNNMQSNSTYQPVYAGSYEKGASVSQLLGKRKREECCDAENKSRKQNSIPTLGEAFLLLQELPDASSSTDQDSDSGKLA